MKKLVLIFVLFLFPIKVYSLSATSVTVMDMDTKRVLYSYNQNEVRLIASISKIMTSLVALNNSNIKDIVTIDESVLKSYGSGIYVEVDSIPNSRVYTLNSSSSCTPVASGGVQGTIKYEDGYIVIDATEAQTCQVFLDLVES